MPDELATLIRLSKLQLDDKRKALTVLLAKEDEMKQMKAGVLQRLADEQARAQDVMEGGRSMGPFIQATFRKCEEIDAAIKQLGVFIEQARDAVQQAFEEVKRYEIAKEQRLARARKEAQKRETKQMDEVGSEITRRRQDQNGERD